MSIQTVAPANQIQVKSDRHKKSMTKNTVRKMWLLTEGTILSDEFDLQCDLAHSEAS
ncbi:hypothetical protein Hanom_Chr05g00447891 [Helianthus anomalus]